MTVGTTCTCMRVSRTDRRGRRHNRGRLGEQVISSSGSWTLDVSAIGNCDMGKAADAWGARTDPGSPSSRLRGSGTRSGHRAPRARPCAAAGGPAPASDISGTGPGTSLAPQGPALASRRSSGSSGGSPAAARSKVGRRMGQGCSHLSENRVPLCDRGDAAAASVLPSNSLNLVVRQYRLCANEPCRPLASVIATWAKETRP